MLCNRIQPYSAHLISLPVQIRPVVKKGQAVFYSAACFFYWRSGGRHREPGYVVVGEAGAAWSQGGRMHTHMRYDVISPINV